MNKSIDTSDITVIIHGPIYNNTSKLVTSISQNLPGVAIMFSSSDTEILHDTTKYDDYISIHNILCIDNISGKLSNYDANQELISIANKIEQIKTKYCLKIKSNMIMLEQNFTYLLDQYQKVDKDYQLLGSKIIIAEENTSITKVSLSDLILFGKTNDIQKIINVEYINKNINKPISQNMFGSFLSNTYQNLDLSKTGTTKEYRKYFINNFIPMSYTNLGFDFLPNKQSKENLIYNNITHNQWKKLYDKYTNYISSSDITIIIPGYFDDQSMDFLKKAVSTYRKNLPFSTIIISTWKGVKIPNGLCDNVIYSEDPGSTKDEIYNIDINIKRQIVSMKAALKAVRSKYILKVRDTTIVSSNMFLNRWKSIDKRIDQYKLFEERVLTCSFATGIQTHIPFHISDIIHFGLKEDIIKIWDINTSRLDEDEYKFFKINKNNYQDEHKVHNYYHTTALFPETYLWSNAFKKKFDLNYDNILDFSILNIEKSNIFFANNVITLPNNFFGLISYKKHSPAAPDLDYNYEMSLSAFDEHGKFRFIDKLYEQYIEKEDLSNFNKYLAYDQTTTKTTFENVKTNHISTNKEPLVSIVIPVYNKEKYIENTLNSILKQTYTNIEILCVNDCSTDKSLYTLKNISKKDKRINIINLPVNKGVANARNLGIEKSNGQYLMFVDADDMLKLTTVEKCINAFAQHSPNMVSFYIQHIRNGIVVQKPKPAPFDNKTYRFMEYPTTLPLVSACGGCFDINYLRQNAMQFSNDTHYEDLLFMHELYSKNILITNINEVLYDYILVENSQTASSISKKQLTLFPTMEKSRKLFVDVGCWHKVEFESIVLFINLMSYFAELYRTSDNKKIFYAFVSKSKAFCNKIPNSYVNYFINNRYEISINSHLLDNSIEDIMIDYNTRFAQRHMSGSITKNIETYNKIWLIVYLIPFLNMYLPKTLNSKLSYKLQSIGIPSNKTQYKNYSVINKMYIMTKLYIYILLYTATKDVRFKDKIKYLFRFRI